MAVGTIGLLGTPGVPACCDGAATIVRDSAPPPFLASLLAPLIPTLDSLSHYARRSLLAASRPMLVGSWLLVGIVLLSVTGPSLSAGAGLLRPFGVC